MRWLRELQEAFTEGGQVHVLHEVHVLMPFFKSSLTSVSAERAELTMLLLDGGRPTAFGLMISAITSSATDCTRDVEEPRFTARFRPLTSKGAGEEEEELAAAAALLTSLAPLLEENELAFCPLRRADCARCM